VRPPRRGFLGRKGWVWTLIASWFVPVVMAIVYMVFAILSDSNRFDWAWLSVGLAIVLVLWWMFRELTQTAAIARAIAVGDADAIDEITTHALSSPLVVGRAKLVLFQAVAFELRGDWPHALDAVAKANIGPTADRRTRVLAASVKVASLVETGEVARARTVLDAELAPLAKTLSPRMDAQLWLNANLARGRVLTAERDAEARTVLQQVIDDVRAGASTRAAAQSLVRSLDQK
jgi:hypothetical protein